VPSDDTCKDIGKYGLLIAGSLIPPGSEGHAAFAAGSATPPYSGDAFGRTVKNGRADSH